MNTGRSVGVNSGHVSISTGIIFRFLCCETSDLIFKTFSFEGTSATSSGSITLSAGTGATGAGGAVSVLGGDNNGAGVSAGSVALLAGSGYNTNQKDGGAGGAVTIAAGTSHGGIYAGEMGALLSCFLDCAHTFFSLL